MDAYLNQFLEEAVNDATPLIDWVSGLSSPSEGDWIPNMLQNATADDQTMNYWYSHLLDLEDEPPPKVLIGAGLNDEVCLYYSIFITITIFSLNIQTLDLYRKYKRSRICLNIVYCNIDIYFEKYHLKILKYIVSTYLQVCFLRFTLDSYVKTT